MLGERLKQIRKKNNMTLQELSNRTELSISYLSNIERNHTSPTVKHLELICDAMQCDIAQIVRSSIGFKPVVKKNERKKLYQQTYRIKNELLTDPGQLMRGSCLTMHASFDEEETNLGHEHDEYFVVAKGSMEVTLNENETYILEEGDAIYIPARTPHRYHRIGDGDTMIYVTTAMA